MGKNDSSGRIELHRRIEVQIFDSSLHRTIFDWFRDTGNLSHLTTNT